MSSTTKAETIEAAAVAANVAPQTSSATPARKESPRMAPTAVAPAAAVPVAPVELTEEEKKRLQEEEEAQQRYKERRAKAKKQKELKQQQEMQRILEEKRLMEEELEELRQSSQTANAQPAAPIRNGMQSATARDTLQVAQQSNNGDNSTAMKKINKIKKRYEKRLAAADEELQELREVRIEKRI